LLFYQLFGFSNRTPKIAQILTLSSKRGNRDAMHILMKTSTQLSHCCWVRKTNLGAKRNFTWGGGSISFADYSQSSASQVLQEKARSTADWSAQHSRVIFGMQFERQ